MSTYWLESIRKRADAFLHGAQCYLDRAEWVEGTDDDDMVEYYMERAMDAISTARRNEEMIFKYEGET